MDEQEKITDQKLIHRGMGSDLMALCGKMEGISGHDQVRLTYVVEQVTCIDCLRKMLAQRGNMDTQEMDEYKTWMYEYVYDKHPKLSPRGDNHEQIMKVMRTTDFDTSDAQLFKAGWEACLRTVKEKIEESFMELP